MHPPTGGMLIERSRSPMTVRTPSRTVTFTHPFNLSGMEQVQPAGTYTVETDEELLQTLSVPAYRRISTLMRLPARPAGPILTQIVEITAVELAAILARDAQPNKTTPQLTREDRVVRRENTASRMRVIREDGNIGLPSTPLI
jgi:hypothetical protein